MPNETEFDVAFDQAVKDFGYGRAVVMFRDRLPVDFWKNMSARLQVLVYSASLDVACLELEKKMFDELADTPIDFNGWHEIFGWAPEKSDLQALALAKMIESASSAEQWEIVYLPLLGDKGLATATLKNIGQVAPTPV